MTTKDQSKVTIGFKVTVEQKQAIAATAKKLSMNISQYLEAMVFQSHPTVQGLCNRKLQIPTKWENHLLELLQPLKNKHPQTTEL